MSAVFRILALVLLTLAVAGALVPADEPASGTDTDDPSAAGLDADSPADQSSADSNAAADQPASDDDDAESQSDGGTPDTPADDRPRPESDNSAAEPNKKTVHPDQAAAEPEKSPRPKERSVGADHTAAARADGKYQFQYKFKPDEVIRWEVVHRAVVDTTIRGTNQTAETRSTSVKMWTVNDVSDKGEITLVHSIESVDMWQKVQGRQEVRYNSRTDETVPPDYQETAAAVGVPLTVVTLDPQGNVLQREEKLRQSNTGNMPLTIPLPAGPVSIGYTWSVPNDVEVILHGGATRKIQTKQKFKLEKVSDGVATISTETQVLTPINDPAIEAQLVQRLTNGTLRFDLEQGRLLSQQLDLDRRVVGFSGASSSTHWVERFTEELMPANTAPATTAAKKSAPAATAKKPKAAAAKQPASASTSTDKPVKAAQLKQPASAMGPTSPRR